MDDAGVGAEPAALAHEGDGLRDLLAGDHGERVRGCGHRGIITTPTGCVNRAPLVEVRPCESRERNARAAGFAR